MQNVIRWKNRKKRGQSLAEFALALPILLFIFMGIIDFGRILISYAQASAAVRNALRYGVILGFTGSGQTPNYLNCDAMINLASNLLFTQVNSVTVEYITAADMADGSADSPIPCSAGMDPNTLDAQIENGDILHVHVEGTIDLITPFFIQSLPLVIGGQRTLVKDIELPHSSENGNGGGDDGGGDGGGDGGVNCGPPPPSPGTDADEDGLDDYWECTNFGNGNQTGTDNPDGDLCSNECEESGSYDPNNPSSPSIPGSVLTVLGEDAGTHCADIKANRYIGLTWSQVVSPDPAFPVQGYRLYATPAGGSRTLVGTFAPPPNPSDPMTCGYSVGSCYNVSGADTFWANNVSKSILYEVEAYNAIGTAPRGSVSYQCVFNVTNLQAGTPDGPGQIRYCSTNKQGDRYMGLTWTGNAYAEGYFIYAGAAQAGRASGGGTTFCGYSVSGANGCYNLNPGAWQANQPQPVTYIVVPYRNGGATVGPLDEAPFISFQCKP